MRTLLAALTALLFPVLGAACATTPPPPPPAQQPQPAPAPNDAGVADAGPAVSEPVDAGPAFVPTTGGKPITAKKLWSTKLEGLGTSSPRTVDLTGDGVLDVVVGGGVQGQSGWVYALDGKTGALLWKARFKEEFYATPLLSDATRDGVPDVFIGGRDFDWTALDGKTGKKLWTLRGANPKADVPRRNFNGGLVVGDQDGDGVDDLLVSQGGSYDDSKRLPGRLFVISAASGKLLGNTPLPDGRETYAVPALLGTSPVEVAVGSGGETLGGHLSRLTVDGGSASVTWAVESGKQGVIASPLVTRINGEQTVVDAFYDGRVVRVDVDGGTVRWEQPAPGFEARASPAPGRFGGSGDVDVVVTRSKGSFPIYKWTNAVTWVDGVTGQVLDQAESGVFSSASPVVVDFDGDGLDETVALSMNAFTIDEGSVVSTLTVYDGARGKAKRLELKIRGAGQSTPAIADVDQDGTLDLVLTYFGVIERYALELPGAPRPNVRWGNFRGPAFNGVDVQSPRTSP